MNKVTKKEQAGYLFTILRNANPNPTTELVFHSGFELLVAVVLSAQATDVSVKNKKKYEHLNYTLKFLDRNKQNSA